MAFLLKSAVILGGGRGSVKPWHRSGKILDFLTGEVIMEKSSP
jgi:hypothetical protein